MAWDPSTRYGTGASTNSAYGQPAQQAQPRSRFNPESTVERARRQADVLSGGEGHTPAPSTQTFTANYPAPFPPQINPYAAAPVVHFQQQPARELLITVTANPVSSLRLGYSSYQHDVSITLIDYGRRSLQASDGTFWDFDFDNFARLGAWEPNDRILITPVVGGYQITGPAPATAHSTVTFHTAQSSQITAVHAAPTNNAPRGNSDLQRVQPGETFTSLPKRR